MKKIYTLLLALCCFATVNAQKNYPILTLEEIGAATIINNEVLMVVIENIGDEPNLAFYDLEKKELMQKFSAKLPENTVANIIPCDNGLLYLLTMKKNPEKGYPLFDAIYSFDHKKDKIKLIYTEKEQITTPRIAAAVHLKLVLSTGVKNQPRLFNIEKGEFEPFSDNENIRMLCASDKHKSYVVVKINEIENEEEIPVYAMDRDGKVSEKIGTYNPSMRISTNKDDNHLPGFTITNTEYNWVSEAYDNSGFPLSGFEIASHPEIAKKFNETANMFEIREIISANETYMAAKGEHQFWVYNTKTLNTTKQKTVSDEDMAAIHTFLNEITEYTKTPVQSAALDQVFNAKFYTVTEKIQESEYGSSIATFIAFAQNNNYEVLMNKAMLTSLVAPKFKIENEQNAALFQDALNALYPPGTFEKKHIQCYKKENSWCFVRDESFGDLKGFVVQLNTNNTIKKIEYLNKIK